MTKFPNFIVAHFIFFYFLVFLYHVLEIFPYNISRRYFSVIYFGNFVVLKTFHFFFYFPPYIMYDVK